MNLVCDPIRTMNSRGLFLRALRASLAHSLTSDGTRRGCACVQLVAAVKQKVSHMFAVICFVPFRPTHAVIHAATRLANKRIFRLFSRVFLGESNILIARFAIEFPK